MPKSKNTRLDKSSTVAETEVVEQESERGSNSGSSVNNTFNQQNNFHLVQNIDLDKLNLLFSRSPEIANRVMDLYEKQLQHNINSDNRILTLEEKEQDMRHKEVPYRRKFAFRSLNFATVLSIASLLAAGYFAYLKYPYLAVTAISIVIGVAVANILGFKAAKQEDNKKDNDKKEE
ncbi:MAG: hypothetical protein PHV08_03825 [Sulfurovaceae bacterium]|nr:hypothetical protein [Sulfurovaceae bacterium]